MAEQGTRPAKKRALKYQEAEELWAPSPRSTRAPSRGLPPSGLNSEPNEVPAERSDSVRGSGVPAVEVHWNQGQDHVKGRGGSISPWRTGGP